MKRTATGWKLEMPDDYREFTHRGVHMKRLTGLHEPGVYEATNKAGEKWRVTGDGSKRYPWRLHVEGIDGGMLEKSLIDVAEVIANGFAVGRTK